MQTDQVIARGRYAEMALALTRAATGEPLIAAGGVWDRLERRPVATAPVQVVKIAMEPAQAPFVEWFAGHVDDARNRRRRNVHLVQLVGDRRSGQTFAAVACLVAALLEVPRTSWGGPSVAAIVSSSYRERDELLRLVRGFIPREWFVERRAPLWMLTFQTGGILRFSTEDEPDSLKRGRSDWCLFAGGAPAAQAAANALRGSSDTGGLTIIKGSSEPWAQQLAEAIDAGRAPGAIRFGAPGTGT